MNKKNVELKKRFKMYKAKKGWIIMPIVFIGVLITFYDVTHMEVLAENITIIDADKHKKNLFDIERMKTFGDDKIRTDIYNNQDINKFEVLMKNNKVMYDGFLINKGVNADTKVKNYKNIKTIDKKGRL